MKKSIGSFLFYLLFFIPAVHAQQTETFNPQKDKEELHGYVIHLMPAPGNTFGFTVVKDKAVVWAQTSNPFTANRQKGFSQKSDAYKLAEWVVSQNETNSHAPIIFKRDLAKQLNISEGLPKQ